MVEVTTMADDVSPGPRPRYKTRSASISAPASTSMENVLMPNAASGQGTPDGGTPGYRRRKPATRSQSARITGARSVSICGCSVLYYRHEEGVSFVG